MEMNAVATKCRLTFCHVEQLLRSAVRTCERTKIEKDKMMCLTIKSGEKKENKQKPKSSSMFVSSRFQ